MERLAVEEPGGRPAGRAQDVDSLASLLRLVDEVWSRLPHTSSSGRPTSDSGAWAAPPGPEADGPTIGRFRVERELGRGGGGVVLEAFDLRLNRTVALKVPRPEALASDSSRNRFLGEARAVARLRHENIVAIFEAEEAGPVPYIVMDHCDAGSLADWLADRPPGGPVSPRWAARLVAQVADGVQRAHDVGILHRDLKPGNILLQRPARGPSAGDRAPGRPDDEPTFVPKVADFGLAKVFGPEAAGRDETETGVLVGTIPYMSPEAARGDRAAIGPATDVYGLGLVLFELLTGSRPFSGSSQAELLDRILNAPPPSPRVLRRNVPADLATICRKCLEKSPGDRYARPGDLADDLRRYLEGRPIRARRAPAWKRLASGVRRHPVGAALLALAAAAAVAAAGAVKAARVAEVRVLLRELESAEVATLPEIVPRLDPAQPLVADRLGRLSTTGTDVQKLGAALVMAPIRPESADFAFERLLEARPRELEPIARLLAERTSNLAPRLEAVVEETPPTTGPDPDGEARDRRRANAACALVAIGRGDRGWSLLRVAPDPQARSFLVHLLGPAGIAPRQIAGRLDAELGRRRDGAGDPSLCRALLLSLGEVPDASWTDDARGRVRARALDLYEHDPDPGVHGAAKWLLLRWGLSDRLSRVDARLAEAPTPPDRRWRIGPLGLTFITIDDPALDRVIEVSDTEVTVAAFLRFRPGHAYLRYASPEPDCPMTSVNYHDAAQFCNWLSDGANEPHSYGPSQKAVIEAVEGHLDRTGFRLLTDREFDVACRAGSITPRYFGTSGALLDRYAKYQRGNDLHASRVALLKPNDLGLFDMLGNAFEICHSSDERADARNRASLRGGCYVNTDYGIRWETRRTTSVGQKGINESNGFRVARTVRPRGFPLATAPPIR